MLPLWLGTGLVLGLGFAQARASPGPRTRGIELSFRWRVALVGLVLIVAIVVALLAGATVAQLCAAAIVLGAAGQGYQAARRRKWGEIALGALRAAFYLAIAIVLLAQWLTPTWRAGLIVTALGVGFRMLRKALVVLALRLGQDLAGATSVPGIERFRRAVTPIPKVLLPLRWQLATNMKRAGVYRPELIDAHFERAIEQMTMLMQIMSAGFPDSGLPQRFLLDDSIRHLHAAHQAGHGVLAVSPHLCAYPVFSRVLADYVPCSIYLRRGKSGGKNTINERIGAAGGAHLVHPPDDASPLEHLTVAMKVLREKRALYITPDLPRKPDEGTPVTIWGRRVYFPTGVILMSMRTRAPVVFCSWYFADGNYHVHFDEPLEFSGRGDRPQRMAAGMQHFARRMNEVLAAHPEMWWNWLDKRWTRILRAPRGSDDQPGVSPPRRRTSAAEPESAATF